MTPTRWQRVQDLVNAALDLPEPERAAFLHDVCGSNTELLRQVEGLVESYQQTGNFLEEAVEASAYEAIGTGSLTEGDRIGPYQITGIIGHGGMGTVYRARRIDDQFRQQVAIKVVHGGFGTTPELVIRFRAERQILASLTHLNIARLLDGGITTSGLPYLVMEYIEGTTIERFVKDQNLSIRHRLELFRQVCAAIQYAHQNLIVHRDIKPANVMVTRDGIPKLLDFGIAKLLSPDSLGQTVAWTRPAERLMTPEYASPEQIRGEAITTTTDVYGLGVLLYELLTGKRPFRTDRLTPAQIEKLICETSPERPSTLGIAASTAALEKIPGDLDNIVFKALHKDPARRYASAAELSEDIRRYLEGFPVVARPDSWRYRTQKFVSRHKIATAAGILFAITTTALSIGLAIQVTRAKREARTSDEVSKFLGSLFENSRPDQTQGRSTSAREILDRGADRITRELKAQPIVESRLLNTLGSVYYQLGALDRAESLLSQAYRIRTKFIGADSDAAAETLYALAEVASDKGEFARAAEDFERALPIYERTKGRNSVEVASVLEDMANLEWRLGDFNRSKERHLEAIRIFTQVKGPTDLTTLSAKNDLEVVIFDQGDYAAAEPLARELLASLVQALGPNHPEVGFILSNLGVLLGRSAHFAEAETLEKRALDLRRKLYPSEHPDLAQSLILMCWIERELGHYKDSEKFGKQGLEMQIKLAGSRSSNAAVDQDQLGVTEMALGHYQQARELLEASLATRTAIGNLKDPHFADNYDHLGLLDLETNHLAAARQNIEHGLEIRERHYGHSNEKVAMSLNNLGRALAAQGNWSGAEQRYREAIAVARHKFPGAHTLTAEGLLGLGTVLLSERRIAEAKPPLLEALEMRRKLLPADHPDIATAAAALTQCERLTEPVRADRVDRRFIAKMK